MIKIELIGNLGADAELKTENGNDFVSFRVAHTTKHTDVRTGEIVSDTTWVSCTKNGKNENLIKYLRKGMKVYLRGNITMKIYTGHDGKSHAGINCYVSEIELCGSTIQEINPTDS